MLFDYGGQHLTTKTSAEQFVGELMKNFTVVLVAEQFDESLVVMKNKLCWDWSDIVYVKVNVGKYKFARFQNESLVNERRKIHQSFSPSDYILYSRSKDKLHEDIKLISNFASQLQEFRLVNKKITSWCSERNLTNKSTFSMSTIFTESGRTVFDYLGCKRLKQNILSYMMEMKNISDSRTRVPAI